MGTEKSDKHEKIEKGGKDEKSLSSVKEDGDINTSKNLTIVFGILFGISEILAQVPNIQSNSVFQLVYTTLKALAER